jgi:N-formylmethionyl-tRNA deformylase
MSLMDVRIYPDPVLRKPAREIETYDRALESFIRDLWETMLAFDGVGLAATHVGRDLRICVISWKEHRLILVNPRIVHSEGEQVGDERCLSFPGNFRKDSPTAKVRVEAVDAERKPFSVDADVSWQEPFAMRSTISTTFDDRSLSRSARDHQKNS